MSFRRTFDAPQKAPNLSVLLLGAAFMVVALIEGALGLSEIFFFATIFAGLGLWSLIRQRELGQLTLLHRAMKAFAAYVIIGVALLVPFELGQHLGGHN